MIRFIWKYNRLITGRALWVIHGNCVKKYNGGVRYAEYGKDDKAVSSANCVDCKFNINRIISTTNEASSIKMWNFKGKKIIGKEFLQYSKGILI